MTKTGSVAAAISQTITDRGSESSMEVVLFGTDDPDVIARELNDLASLHLRSAVERCLFYECSQGAVLGLELEDGRRVAVKAHQPDRSAAFLVAVQDVQRHLWGRGFPCPAPILGPTPLGTGLAVADEFLDAGTFMDAHDPAVRKEMANALAALVRMAQPFVSSHDLPHSPWLDLPAGSLWRPPHHPRFDFDATTAGAEWIDAIAAEALTQVATPVGELVVGHTDWSVKDFRFLDGKISAIYDWDSLAVDREPLIVGRAATHFTMTWRLSVRVAPAPGEVAAFVTDYEEARGSLFSAAERAAVDAAGAYSMAYTARCEHALDPHAAEYPVGSARGFLAGQK
jgi:hypothetical protein